MKKKLAIVALFVMIMVSAVGCGHSEAPTTNESTVENNQESNQNITIYTSFYPMYDFTKKIAGDRAEVINMVPAGVEPHDWEPSASDMAKLEKASMFIYNGAGFEAWVDKMLASSVNQENLVIVEASQGIPLLQGEEHTHDENEADADHVEGDELYDPHIWLNPEYAKQEMETIKNALVEVDPENKTYYEANYTKYATQFDELDQKYRDTLTSLTNKDIIVAHAAYGYLCDAYGLTQISISGLSADQEPSPARMAEIVSFANEHQVKTIFFEELTSAKVAETIANEVGAKTAVLDPIEGLSDEKMSNDDDYFTIMEANLAALKEALSL